MFQFHRWGSKTGSWSMYPSLIEGCITEMKGKVGGLAGGSQNLRQTSE